MRRGESRPARGACAAFDMSHHLASSTQPGVSYAPRGLRAVAAAAYLGMSKSKFLELVQAGRLPQPVAIDTMRVWDRFELDAAFDAIKAEPVNSFDAILGVNK